MKIRGYNNELPCIYFYCPFFSWLFVRRKLVKIVYEFGIFVKDFFLNNIIVGSFSLFSGFHSMLSVLIPDITVSFVLSAFFLMMLGMALIACPEEWMVLQK